MEEYVFLETLPSGASQHTKYLQQSKVRSRAAAIGRRKVRFEQSTLNNAPKIPESRKQPRRAWTAVYRIGPSPQYFRSSRDASGSNYTNIEPGRDSSEYWQLVKRFDAGPRSLLSASRRDPFGTYPVSRHSTRFEQLLDFAITNLPRILLGVEPTEYPINVVMTLSKISMQDTAAFHAVLALIASIWANIQGSGLQSETTYHKFECIRIISSRLNEHKPPSDGTLYAVMFLWTLEANFITPEALQAHINGLGQMIKYRGGVSSLSSEVQFMLAWLIITAQGQIKIPFRREPDTTQSTIYTPSWILSSYYEISDFLSNLNWLSRSSPSIFQVNAHFFGPQSPLHLLRIFEDAGLKAFRDPTTVAFFAHLMSLLWILAIFLEYTQSPLQLMEDLQDLQIQLQRHELDRSGSPMMLCWVLLRKEESLELHPRSWAVVRFINVIKTWDVSRQRILTTLLLGYLLGNLASEDHQQLHNCVMEGIMEDLETLNEESEK